MMGRWTFCYIWFQLLAAHINFMKGKKKNNIGRFQGNECVKPSWSVWPWDVAGNPKRCRNISQMQRHFRGHSVAFLEAQMVKNPSDKNFPPTYRYLCPFLLMLPHFSVSGPLSILPLQAQDLIHCYWLPGLLWRGQSLPASGVVGRPGQW